MRRILLALIGAGLLAAVFHGTWRPTLWGPTEPREMAIALETSVRDARFAITTFAGMPFLEKPPLYPEAVALAFRLSGSPSVIAARLVTAFFACLWLVATVALVRACAGPRAGWLAGALLVLAPNWFRLARRIQLDIALAAFLSLALLFVYRSITNPNPRARANAWRLALLMVALASFTKGLFAPFLFLAPTLVYAFVFRDSEIRRRLARPETWLWLAAPFALWGIRLWAAGGTAYLVEHFVNNSLGRFLSHRFEILGVEDLPYGDVNAPRPWWYYFAKMPFVVGPAILAFPPALVALLRNGRTNDSRRHRLAALALCWGVVPPILLSVSSQKGIHHLGSCVTGLVVVSTLWLHGFLRVHDTRPWPARTWLATAIAIAGVWVVVAAAWLGHPATVAGTVATGTALAAIGGIGLFHAIRRRTWYAAALVLSATAVALLAVGFSPGLIARTDEYRSIDAFADWVAAEVRDHRVGVYAWRDGDLGAVCWALRRPAVPLTERADVDTFLAEAEPSFCVLKRKYLPDLEDALASGAATVVAESGNADLRFVLLANRAAAKTLSQPTIPPPYPTEG